MHIDWLPSHEAHLQGAFSTVQSKAPVERQRSQAPPLGLQTREVRRSWEMLVLPGDNHLVLSSAAPVLLKVNPARRKEKDLIMQLFATLSYRGAICILERRLQKYLPRQNPASRSYMNFWNVISLC